MTHFSRFSLGLITLAGVFFLSGAKASPVWTFSPLTNTQVTVDASSTATIQYTVTNQSRLPHTLIMTDIPGVSRTTTAGNCGNPVALGYQESCTLTLVVTGSELSGNVVGGPVLCQQGGGTLQCSEPFPSDALNITLSSATPVAIGDSYGGGTVACLTSEGGEANLIAATADNSTDIAWGGRGTETAAQSFTNGATNTTTIVDCLTNGTGCTTPLNPPIALATYAAGLCSSFESDGYTDWFLPATDQLNCLYENRVAIGGFTSSWYWDSTEDINDPTIRARDQNFGTGVQSSWFKDNAVTNVRCVRAFTP